MLACAVALGLIAIALPFEAKSVLIGIKSSTDKGCFVIGFSPVSLTYFSIKVRSKICPDGETHGFVISEPESAQSNMFSICVRFQFGGLNWFFFYVISLSLSLLSCAALQLEKKEKKSFNWRSSRESSACL